MVDFYAGHRHYAEHLLPVWEALDPDERGTFYGRRPACYWLGARGIPSAIATPRRGGGPPVVVASFEDLRTARYLGRVTALLEHGAGQTYGDRHASNPGGIDRAGCRLFLCPSDRVAEANRKAYPDVPAVVVGCPKLDGVGGFRDPETPDRVAVSFHWNNPQAPESRWAFPHYSEAVKRLPPGSLGHGHPRAWRFLDRFYRFAGLESVAEFSEVLERAAVYVCDNSSTLYEFAAIDRPVVVLNAPGYRRDVDHGLRFWELADVGVQCDQPEDLPAAIATALEDPPEQAEKRRLAVAAVYPALDGQAAQRAAEALREHL